MLYRSITVIRKNGFANSPGKSYTVKPQLVEMNIFSTIWEHLSSGKQVEEHLPMFHRFFKNKLREVQDYNGQKGESKDFPNHE